MIVTKNICNVCESKSTIVLYSDEGPSLTSMCQILDVKTEIFYCKSCEHVYSEPLANNKLFYEKEYNISLDFDDEDQVYETNNEKIIYRTDHQMMNICDRVNFNSINKLLDFGCAKAEMSNRLKEKYPHLDIYLYDVSYAYLDHWNKINSVQYSIHEIPNSWENSFDLITSYFSLEHIPNPTIALNKMYSLLRDDGQIYCIVPNFLENIGDFIVVDHINHFTENSLYHLFSKTGFSNIKIENDQHRGALIVSGVKKKTRINNIKTVRLSLQDEILKISEFWNTLQNKITNIHALENSAIYGSGFYGTYLFAKIKNNKNIKYFIDINPFQQKKIIFNLNVVKHDSLDLNDIKTIYVGLNPKIAKQIISSTFTTNKFNFILIP